MKSGSEKSTTPTPPPAQPEVDFEALERLLGEATPGPWFYHKAFGKRAAPWLITSAGRNTTVVVAEAHGSHGTGVDAKLIAFLRNNAPALLRLARLGAGKGPAAGLSEVTQWHASRPGRVFAALCGADARNLATTSLVTRINCAACQLAIAEMLNPPPLDQAARAAASPAEELEPRFVHTHAETFADAQADFGHEEAQAASLDKSAFGKGVGTLLAVMAVAYDAEHSGECRADDTSPDCPACKADVEMWTAFRALVFGTPESRLRGGQLAIDAIRALPLPEEPASPAPTDSAARIKELEEAVESRDRVLAAFVNEARKYGGCFIDQIDLASGLLPGKPVAK